jgi:hypothetical protein
MRQAAAIERVPASPALELLTSASHNGAGRHAGWHDRTMPTLFRFLVTIGILVGIVYGAMFALVTFVEPKKGEITVRVPLDKLNN